MPEGYKQTEVGVIPDDWDIKPLKTISPKQSVGLVINPSTYFDEAGTIPMLVGSNVGENKIDWASARRITEESNQSLPASRLYAGDLVMVRVGDPGTSAVIPPEFDGCNCASMMIVRKHPSFSSEWLCSLMNSPFGRSRVSGVQYGTAQKQFNISDAVDFLYPVPKISEQQAIASTLSDIDELLALLDQLIAKKRDLKQATMQQLLTGKKRLPGFREVWESKSLRELAHVQRGASPRPINSPIWFDESSSVGWVRISDVTRSGMHLCNTEQQLSLLGIQHSRPVAKNSLIMSICATVGRPVITKIDVCIHDGFVVFDNLQSDQLFMYYVLKWIEPDWSKHGQTGSQMNLNTELINNTIVDIPSSPKEQEAIAQILTDIDTELTTLQTRRTKTQALKQAMMQQLLTGQTRLITPA